LAKTGKEWMDHFKRENSGTYNNQWMVLDYNKMRESPKDLVNGTFMVAEQGSVSPKVENCLFR
jgi:hypothetical protein